MVIEFCSALYGLHEIHMKALSTPRFITHINMRADNAQGVASMPPRTASYGLRYANIVKANSFYDSGTSHLFALMLLRYVSDLYLRRLRVLMRCSI